MPDDEMDMAVDFSQVGYGEDIDIDLDFPAGQPDEDMDLGDFDRIHDIQNFNSDARDELMAEGDDASYGMVDAIDVEHNASAAVANDIDIDLEQTVEGIWQQEPQHTAEFQPDTEIDYIDEPTVENINAQANNINTGEWLSTATNVQNIDVMDHADGLSAELLTGAQETQGEPPIDDLTSFESTSAPTPTLPTNVEAAHSSAVSGEKTTEEPSEVDIAPEDNIAVVELEKPNQSLTADQDGESASQPNGDDGIKTPTSNAELHEYKEHLAVDRPDQASESVTEHVQGSLASQDVGQLDHSDDSGAGDTKEDHSNPAQHEEGYESANDTSEYQSGGASYNDITQDQTGADDNVSQNGSALDNPDSEPVEASPGRYIDGDENRESTITGVEATVTEASDKDDPFELTDRYGVYISYGQTDYRLFASSGDDDPNQYFLTDKSALDVPLSRFLTSLREVISEEISPLDDLVLEIDGLGLEFSESTAPDFLDKFTFGDLVILYDKLVKNEQVESCPPIYSFLTVKPNCSRRMMALGESANAGRGLSEVGLYRDESSPQDEHVDDVDSPDTNYSSADYDEVDSGSIHRQEEYEENGKLDGDEHENPPPVDTEEQVEQKSGDEEQPEHISTHEEEEFERTSGYDEADRFDDENEETSVDAPTDGVDLEHPVPISDQDETTNGSPTAQSQGATEHSQQTNLETSKIEQSKPLESKTAAMNPAADAPTSEHTSVTATLDGDDYEEGHDEIDYDSDEGEGEIDAAVEEVDAAIGEVEVEEVYATIDAAVEEVDAAIDEVDEQKQLSTPELSAPIDDEITWESEDDQDENETKGGSPKDMVQVSSLSTKRSHAESGASDGTDDKNDHKRLRA